MASEADPSERVEDLPEEAPRWEGEGDGEELERRLAQTRTLANFTQRALQGMELDRLLEEVCLATVGVLETDYCDVFQYQPEAEQLILRAGVGWPDEYYDRETLDASPGSQSGYTVATWEPTVVEDIREDERFRRPSLFEEADVRGGVTVVVPGPGQPWGVFGVHSLEPRSFDQYDVTFVQSMGQVLSQAVQRARADERLQEERERFASLVREVREYAVFRLDEEGHVRSWNLGAERMKGYTEEEILGMHFSVLYTEEDRREGRATRNLERAVENDGAEDEGWRVRKDGTRFWAHVTINPYRDEEGSLRGFWKVVRDLSERKDYERQLEESNERLEQFAYAASHDLQEPLRMVTSYLQLLEDDYREDLDERAQGFVDDAIDGARRMSRMVDSLLDYARVATEARPLRTVDADDVLDDALEDLQLHIEETGAEVTREELPTVRADPDQLAQVFRNLVSNALKYSGGDPPRIHVGADEENGRWRIWVRDEGPGIDSGDADRLFQAFERSEPEGEAEPGTGMGLAICQQIVDRHGGEMAVDSEPGEGSTFRFTMPAADDESGAG